jgi:hypothetical protein
MVAMMVEGGSDEDAEPGSAHNQCQTREREMIIGDNCPFFVAFCLPS